jgi:hypothetical protein
LLMISSFDVWDFDVFFRRMQKILRNSFFETATANTLILIIYCNILLNHLIIHIYLLINFHYESVIRQNGLKLLNSLKYTVFYGICVLSIGAMS